MSSCQLTYRLVTIKLRQPCYTSHILMRYTFTASTDELSFSQDASCTYISSPQLSKAVGAVTKITTKLLKINAPAITLTSNILPLLAGNLPLIT
jgi:hypothetical protein